MFLEALPCVVETIMETCNAAINKCPGRVASRTIRARCSHPVSGLPVCPSYCPSSSDVSALSDIFSVFTQMSDFLLSAADCHRRCLSPRPVPSLPGGLWSGAPVADHTSCCRSPDTAPHSLYHSLTHTHTEGWRLILHRVSTWIRLEQQRDTLKSIYTKYNNK